MLIPTTSAPIDRRDIPQAHVPYVGPFTQVYVLPSDRARAWQGKQVEQYLVRSLILWRILGLGLPLAISFPRTKTVLHPNLPSTTSLQAHFHVPKDTIR